MTGARSCETCARSWRLPPPKDRPIYCSHWANGGPAVTLDYATEPKRCGPRRIAWEPEPAVAVEPEPAPPPEPPRKAVQLDLF